LNAPPTTPVSPSLLPLLLHLFLLPFLQPLTNQPPLSPLLDLQRAQKVAEKEIKAAAKENRLDAARILARQLVASRKTAGRLAMARANLMDLSNELKIQQSTLRTANAMKSSTQASKAMSNLIKIPQLQKTVREMSKEMYTAGMLGEAMEDAMDIAMGGEDIEEETAEAVDKVLNEVAGDVIANLVNAPLGRKTGQKVQQQEDEEGLPDDGLIERLANGD